MASYPFPTLGWPAEGVGPVHPSSAAVEGNSPTGPVFQLGFFCGGQRAHVRAEKRPNSERKNHLGGLFERMRVNDRPYFGWLTADTGHQSGAKEKGQKKME